MIVKTKTVYQCEYCKRNMFVKSAMEKHIEWCGKNPKNKVACDVCEYLMIIETEYLREFYGGESMQKCKGFKCKKRDKELYPLKAVRKGLVDKYPESFEGKELMPKECEYRKMGFDESYFKKNWE